MLYKGDLNYVKGMHQYLVLAAGLLCVILVVGSAAMVLPRRSLWFDEVTQMSGLSGSPIEVTRWLMGRVDYNNDLPDDRMPPLSYWAGWLWSKVFGLGEKQMRWFSIVCAGGATFVVFKTAERSWGPRAGVGAGLLFALSPNVIDRAVGIRCYSLFTLTSSITIYCMTRVLTANDQLTRRWIMLMTLSAIAAMYTHFYGLILTVGCFAAVLLLTLVRRRPIRMLLPALLIIGIAIVGLLPFVTASVGLSPGLTNDLTMSNTNTIRALAQWAYRQFFHASISVRQEAVLAGIAGVVLLCGVIGKRAFHQELFTSIEVLAIGLLLLTGSAMVLAAQFVVKSFSVTQPNYSVWMLPGWALLFGSACGERKSRCPQF